MSELNITHWSDFVRGLATPETAEQMQDHLEGESSARSTVEALRRVAAVGRADHDSPVPPSAVRIAKALAVTARSKAAPSVRRVPFAVTFDSLFEAAPAGARNLQRTHRELTFESQGYTVDLQMEQGGEPTHEGALGAPSARRLVVGQLLRRSGEAEAGDGSSLGAVSRAPVFMFSGEQVVGKAVTGHHGEFQIEGSLLSGEAGGESIGESLNLCLVAGDDFLELPLTPRPDVASEDS